MYSEVHQVNNIEDLKNCYELLIELREDLSYIDFLNYYEISKRENNFTILCLKKKSEIVALLGYRILTDFLHGRHIYIDDLVTKKTYRCQGLGGLLLKEMNTIAREESCKVIRLCTGIDNSQGRVFYEKNSMKLKAVVYKNYI